MPTPPTEVLFLDATAVVELLPMAEAIAVLAETFAELGRGEAGQPLRSALWLPDRRGLLGTAAITAIRTAAVSALATRHLARSDASDLALLGSGTQARTHLEALCLVRPIRRVRVWSPTAEHAARFAAREAARSGLSVTAVVTPEAAVSGADLICTVSAAAEPVLHGRCLAPGCHVNAVGACTPKARELDSEAVRRARVIVDRRESAWAEAGDLLIPRAAGEIDESAVAAELAEVVLGTVPGRRSDSEITLFKSLGLGVEDAASARHIEAKARAEGRGLPLPSGGFHASP